jgi:hypothetical protein
MSFWLFPGADRVANRSPDDVTGPAFCAACQADALLRRMRCGGELGVFELRPWRAKQHAKASQVNSGMTNALRPHLMNANERLTEVAEILAAGILRLRRQQPSEPRLSEKNGLDFPAGRSVHATSRKRRRVAR